MKVLALGGSGGMGRYAVQYLYKIEQIDKIYIADVNASSAKNLHHILIVESKALDSISEILSL